MRQFDRKKGNMIVYTACGVGIVLLLLGAAFTLTWLFDVGIVLTAAGIGYRISYFRCPHCRRSLNRDMGDYCPYCHKRLNKRK